MTAADERRCAQSPGGRFRRHCVGEQRSRRRRQGVGAHRPRDVLEVLVPEVDESHVQLVAHLSLGVFRQADSVRLADALEPRCDIDPVAYQVAVGLLDDVAQMNADAKPRCVLSSGRPALRSAKPLRTSRAQRTASTTLRNSTIAVAGPLDHASVVARNRRVEEVTAQRPESGERALLVSPSQPAIADDVGNQNGCKFAGLTHEGPSPRDRNLVAVVPNACQYHYCRVAGASLIWLTR